MLAKLLAEADDLTSERLPQIKAKPASPVPMLAILRLLSTVDRPMGVNAIARELSLAPSSCFKALKQLQAEEFVDFDERTKCYSPGTATIELARRALDPQQAFSVVRPRLEESALRFSMANGFWRVIPRSRIMLAGFVEGGRSMWIHMAIGQRLPLLMGGVGRAIAATLDLEESEMRAEFARMRWQRPISFREYVDQVEIARQRGFAVDCNHFAPGVTTVGVAIRDKSGVARYGLSGAMFSGQHDDATIERVGHELVEVAGWASRRLVTG